MAFLSLRAVLGLDGTGFGIGLKRAESASAKFASEVKGQFARAFGVTAIVLYARKVIEMADTITDASVRLGISTEELQKWFYAAKKSGADQDKVIAFFEALALSREKALEGNDNLRESYRNLGVTLEDLKSDRFSQLGKTISETIRRGDVQKLSAALKEVGGRGATSLIPAMKGGIKEMGDEAERLGFILSDDTLFSLKQIKNEIELIADSFHGEMAGAIIFVARRVEDLLDGFKAIGGFLGAFSGTLAGSQMPEPKKGKISEFIHKYGGIAGKLATSRSEAGALAPIKDAFAAGMKKVEQAASDREAREARRAQTLVSHRAAIRAGEGGSDAQERLGKQRGPQVNQLQRIGAFISGPKPELRELQKIERHTRDTVHKLSNLSGEEVQY